MPARIAFLGDTPLGDAARPVLGEQGYGYALADQGIGVASLANNHVSVFGPSGVLDTMAALDAAGIAQCGAGRTDIAALRAEVDLCVVLVHRGRNYRPVTARQRCLARDIVAAGADVVVGHHPHIAQPVVAVDGLGNAAFGMLTRHFPVQPPYGLVAVVDAEPHRVAGLDLRLIEVDNRVVGFQPRPAEGPAASAFLSSLYTPVFPACGERGRSDRSPGRVAGARRLDA